MIATGLTYIKFSTLQKAYNRHCCQDFKK